MDNDPFKENIEKSKKVLKEHFKQRKQEEIYKEMFREVNRSSYSMLNPPHSGTNWDTDDEELDDFTKSRDSFYEKLIWSDITKEEENKMKNYIIKKTEKIRYKLASIILKQLTPALYKKIDLNTFTNNRVFQFKSDNIPNTIRPSIKFMKERFNGKLVQGAEIGVERGKNSESILNELNIGKLFLIDIWTKYEGIYIIWLETNYNQVLRKFKNDERVEIIKEFSNVAASNILDNTLDFVYIDANHKYDYVYQDIKSWYPKVKKGGVMGGHDIFLINNNSCDVLNAVKKFCFENKIYFNIEPPDWYFIKT